MHTSRSGISSSSTPLSTCTENVHYQDVNIVCDEQCLHACCSVYMHTSRSGISRSSTLLVSMCIRSCSNDIGSAHRGLSCVILAISLALAFAMIAFTAAYTSALLCSYSVCTLYIVCSVTSVSVVV
jgi:hypothetical protein